MRRIAPKPKGLGPEYGAQFQDYSVADAYATRPPYPAEVYAVLLGLIRDEPRIVLDLGCGTGDISRGLAPHGVYIQAVDPSAAMIARGRALPGGRHHNIEWIASTAEAFSYHGPYALVVTAESLHWMDWYRVLPDIGRSLAPHGRLAIVFGRDLRDKPWAAEVAQLIARYSTNREYEPYDLLAELAARSLFAPEGRLQTRPVPFSQTVDAYVESFHSRNGFSRERMGESAAAFDVELRAIIGRYQTTPVLEFEVVASLAWGVPASE